MNRVAHPLENQNKPEKYQNKYRIPSARLRYWDYAKNAAYFITICTHQKLCWFGNVTAECNRVQLSDMGQIVQDEWIKTLLLRPDMNLELGEFIVMPNHFHGIVIIGENKYNQNCDVPRRDAMHGVSTKDMHGVSTKDMHGVSTNKFGPQRKNLASIVRGFKSAVTREARVINPDFSWQTRYHDHIIRNDQSYTKISDYIIYNPAKWKEDEFYEGQL